MHTHPATPTFMLPACSSAALSSATGHSPEAGWLGGRPDRVARTRCLSTAWPRTTLRVGSKVKRRRKSDSLA
jgi:hypothetical protein